MSTTFPPIEPGGMARMRGSSSTATSVSQRTTMPSTCSSANLKAPATLLQWGDRGSKLSTDRTVTPRDRKWSRASEASEPTTWTTRSWGSTPAMVVSDTNQRSASRWNLGCSSTTQEKTPLTGAPSAFTCGLREGSGSSIEPVTAQHRTRAQGDQDVETRFDQAPRCRLRHRLMPEETRLLATVTSGNGPSDDVGVECTTGGPGPAM